MRPELLRGGTGLRAIGAELLRGIVERRQIEVGLVHVVDIRHRLEIVDARAPDAGRGKRPPIPPEGKAAAQLAQKAFHPRRLRVARHHHSAAVLVNRGGGENQFNVFAERLLEEKHARRFTPDARTLHESRTLLPEEGLAQVIHPVTVGDKPVPLRGKPRSERRLGDARDGGEYARLRLEVKPRHIRQSVAFGEIPAECGRHDRQFSHDALTSGRYRLVRRKPSSRNAPTTRNALTGKTSITSSCR